MAFDKTPKLPFWLEIIVSLEDQNVGHFLLWAVNAGVKCVADIMCYSVGRLEQQQNLICICTFDAVTSCNPGCVLHQERHMA